MEATTFLLRFEVIMRRSRLLTLAITLAPLVGCYTGDVAGPTPDAECTENTGSVSVTVSSAAQPVFDWGPACSLALFLVEDGGSDQWAISTDDTLWDDPDQANLIAPPVTYGVVPAGADQFAPAETLVPGVTYTAVLWRVLTTGSTATCVQRFENLCLLAVHEFTR